jgi:tetratricopeptide (TPR) repeat protein
MAAVLGSRLNDIEMYRLADVTIGQAMTALGRLTDLRILRDGGRGLEFCNEVVRGEAYLAIPSPVRKALHRGVADLLVQRESNGVVIPGLEIAWHCIRGGQLAIATPFLLRGAKEAIRRGAPNEAERAIQTALDHLSETTKADALLLLAEALHEQGRWESVLEVLKHSQLDRGGIHEEQKLLLSVEPRSRLGLFRGNEATSVISQLLELGRTGSSTQVKVRAITTAAYQIAYFHQHPALQILAELIAIAKQDLLSAEDFAHLAIANAICHYHRRQTELAINELTEAATRLQGNSLHSHVAVSVQIALANITSASGDYRKSVVHNTLAYNLATAIGNDHTCARAAANLTLCFSRLGEYSEAVAWSRRAIEKDPLCRTDSMSFCLFHASIAYAMLGKTDDSLRLLTSLDLLAQTAKSQEIKQNAYLFLADGYLTLGKKHEAYQRARVATTGPLEELIGFNYVGYYARWVAALAVIDRSSQGFDAIDRLMDIRTSFDCIDQTDILCARALLERHLGLANSDTESMLKDGLLGLPPGVTEQLIRKGFLS